MTFGRKQQPKVAKNSVHEPACGKRRGTFGLSPVSGDASELSKARERWIFPIITNSGLLTARFKPRFDPAIPVQEVIMHRTIALQAIRFLTLAAIGAGMFIVDGCGNKYPYEEVLRRNSEAINKKCPIAVDVATRLDSTSAGPGRRFTYYYTLTRQVLDSIDVQSMNWNLKPMLIGNLRSNKSLEMLRKNKANIDYCFFDRKGRFVLSVPVTPADYAQ
jgi:hypothetical protein